MEMIINSLHNKHLVELNAELSSSFLMAWFADNIVLFDLAVDPPALWEEQWERVVPST